MTTIVPSQRQHTVVIVGGGTGGVAVAALLLRKHPQLNVAVIDPAEHHFYQPAWTLVGGGAYRAEDTRRKLADVLPKGARHIAKKVTALLPDDKQVELEGGEKVSYDFLVVAAGIQINWGAIDGLEAALGKNGVTSNYRYDLASYTWDLVQNLKGGNAIFTQPAGAVKCPGAPQKALYLSADHFKRNGIKPDSVQFRSGGASVFGVAFYAKALDKVMEAYGADTHYGNNLVAVKGAEKIAVFERKDGDAVVREEVPYELLHVVPPQGAPDFIKNSPLADAAGWLEVDKNSLRHTRYANVFGVGDCTSSPNSKTCAAIKAQTPVLVANLLAAIAGQQGAGQYDGYAACPLTTSRGKVLLAEFTFGGTVTPSFPVDPRVPRGAFWWLKRSFLPWFYWNLLLKGRQLPVTHKVRNFPEAVPPLTP